MSRPTRRFAAISLSSLLISTTLALAQEDPPPAQGGAPEQADIVVTATRTEESIQRVGSAITVIPREEIEKASARNVGDLLRQVPGVTMTQSGGPGRVETVRIRGGDVRHTLVLIDGIRVNDPISTGREFDFSTLVLADVERIEVLRGPQSALYGSDAMGGVINIITKRGSGPPKANVSIEGGSFGTKEIKGGLSGGDGTVDYSFGFAGYDTAGFSAFGYRIGRLAAAVPWGLEPDNAKRFGLTGRIGIALGDNARLEFGASSSYNRAQFDGFFDPLFSPFPDTPSRGWTWLHNVYSRLIWDAFDGNWRNTVTLFANRNDRTSENVSFGKFGVFCGNRFFPDPAIATCRQDTFFLGDRKGAEYQGDVKMGAFGLLTFGTRIEHESADSASQLRLPELEPRIRTIEAEQVTRSAFALHQVTLFERWHISLGGRVDDIQDGPVFQTWRASSAYDIWETGTKIRASAGTGAKAPSLFQLFSPDFGTSTLRPEHSFGSDIGVDQRILDGRLTLSVTVFRNRYRNLIDFTTDVTRCKPGQFFGCYFNVARAHTQGSEYSADFSLVPQFVRLKVTYTDLWAVDWTTGLKLARRPGHEGRAALIITPLPGLIIEPSVVYVSHRFDFPNMQGRLPTYARLDLYGEYRINETFSVYIRGQNLTNARYEEVRNFGTPGRTAYAGVRATW